MSAQPRLQPRPLASASEALHLTLQSAEEDVFNMILKYSHIKGRHAPRPHLYNEAHRHGSSISSQITEHL